MLTHFLQIVLDYQLRSVLCILDLKHLEVVTVLQMGNMLFKAHSGLRGLYHDRNLVFHTGFSKRDALLIVSLRVSIDQAGIIVKKAIVSKSSCFRGGICVEFN